MRNSKTFVLQFQQDGAPTLYALAVREYLIEITENVKLAVDDQCCPLHLTVHLEAQTCHRVIIYCGAASRRVLHSSATKPLKTSGLLLNVSPRKCSEKCSTEYGAENDEAQTNPLDA
jgi:hypothetical protein